LCGSSARSTVEVWYRRFVNSNEPAPVPASSWCLKPRQASSHQTQRWFELASVSREGLFVTSLVPEAVNSFHHVRACRPPIRQSAAATTITSAVAARRTAGTGSGGGIPESATVTTAPTTSAAPNTRPWCTRVACDAPSLVTPESEKASPTTPAAGSPAATSAAMLCSQNPEMASQAKTTIAATATPPREYVSASATIQPYTSNAPAPRQRVASQRPIGNAMSPSNARTFQ